MISTAVSILENPTTLTSEVEHALRSVMQSLLDSEEGFQYLGQEVKAPGLRRYFLEESSMRAQFRSELDAVLQQEGIEDSIESGIVAGALNRAWAELKSALGGDDRTLLVTAEQADDEANEAYRNALGTELPYPVQQLLISQAGHIQASHDIVRTTRDSSK
jgi:uncharacterized protein (TIGR02284 family)